MVLNPGRLPEVAPGQCRAAIYRVIGAAAALSEVCGRMTGSLRA